LFPSCKMEGEVKWQMLLSKGFEESVFRFTEEGAAERCTRKQLQRGHLLSHQVEHLQLPPSCLGP
jgi:hypothetical protein